MKVVAHKSLRVYLDQTEWDATFFLGPYDREKYALSKLVSDTILEALLSSELVTPFRTEWYLENKPRMQFEVGVTLKDGTPAHEAWLDTQFWKKPLKLERRWKLVTFVKDMDHPNRPAYEAKPGEELLVVQRDPDALTVQIKVSKQLKGAKFPAPKPFTISETELRKYTYPADGSED